MIRAFLFFLLMLVVSPVFAKTVTTISGIAPSYVNQEVSVHFYEDYLSMVRTKVASTKVKGDGAFSLTFYNDETQKVFIQVGKNNLSLYIEPEAKYNLHIEKNSPYLDRQAVGIEVEFYFLDLDSTDINYKILLFENQQLDFLKEFYHHTSLRSTQFVTELDSFKLALTKQYENEKSNFFKTYVRYSIASLDNLSYVGQRNEYEKYDFYIKNEPIHYENDRYMDYLLHYYEKYEVELSNEVNQELYDGVIKSSPSAIMNALAGDYALRNIRIRELIMVRMLSEMFFTEVYPRTNIISILDSVSANALFEEHKTIASNLLFRLLDLRPGTKMPDFSFIVNGIRTYKDDYAGKHVYIQFVSQENRRSIDDLKLLVPLYAKYSKYIEFITILVGEESDQLRVDASPFITEHAIAWDFSFITKDDPLLKRMSVSTYPYYLLMDATGNVVAAPALSPRPNNEYETIEHNLHSIYRYYKSLEEQEERGW